MSISTASSKKSLDYTIELWSGEDKDEIRHLLFKYLEDVSYQGSDFVPCTQNVTTLWNVGIQAAQKEQPALFVRSGNMILAFLLWASQEGFVLRDKDVLFTYGTYVMPEYRGNGISSRLRIAGTKIAKDLGFKRVIGTIYGVDFKWLVPTGVREVSSIHAGFKPYGIVGELVLEE